MNRVLVAIESCHQYENRRSWQRKTWIPALNIDYRFFVGHYGITNGERWQSQALLEEDVVTLDCNDDYNSLPEKTYAIIKWAKGNGYTNLLKIDDDVYARPERLVVPEEDYVGHAYGHKTYCSGAAYWLSTKAMDSILSSWVRRTNAEDWCVGETLKFAGIKLTEDPRYRIGWRSFKHELLENEFPHPDNDTITFHMYFPDFMVEMHANWDKKKQLVDATHFNSLKNRD